MTEEISNEPLDSTEVEPPRKKKPIDFTAAEYVQIKASNAEVGPTC